ncbi:MAG TPA: winged helix DNA-binding domain-containing protein [Microlunatus sp.]|nr:winged helix DNA-binding domain-containing protein [Microlunatus sp.]
MLSFDDDERRARLAGRHHLLPHLRTDDVVRIAEDLVALHSTDPVTAVLSVLVRMDDPSVAAVEAVVYEQRRLIRHHAMRRTLWLATPDTVRLMHAAATRKLVGPARRQLLKLLSAAAVPDPESWLVEAEDQVLAHVRTHGPSTGREIGQQVAGVRVPLRLAPGKPYASTQGAHSQLITLLGFEGKILRARSSSWITGAYAYTAAEDWLPGGLGELDELPAAIELAGRWLRRFGPATTTDLQWWMGWTLGLTRRALEGCGAQPVQLSSGPGWLAVDDPPFDRRHTEPWVTLLPALDPTTMGWKQRSWYLPVHAAEAFDSVGNGGPTIWVDGRIVGAWAQDKQGEIHLHYFEKVPLVRRRDVEARVAELKAVVGTTRFAVRFPGGVHARLLGG